MSTAPRLCRSSTTNKNTVDGKRARPRTAIRPSDKGGRPTQIHKKLKVNAPSAHDYSRCVDLRCDLCQQICSGAVGQEMVERGPMDHREPCTVAVSVIQWKSALDALATRIKDGEGLMEQMKQKHYLSLNVEVFPVHQQATSQQASFVTITIHTLLSATSSRHGFVFEQTPEPNTIYEELDVGVLFLTLYQHGVKVQPKTSKLTANNNWHGPEVHIKHEGSWWRIINTAVNDDTRTAIQPLLKKIKQQRTLIKNAIEKCSRNQPNVQRPVVGLGIPGAPIVQCVDCRESFSRLFYEQVESNFRADRARILQIESKKKTATAQQIEPTQESASDDLNGVHEIVELLDNVHLERERKDKQTELWRCTQCRFQKCNISGLAMAVEAQAAALAKKADIFARPCATKTKINYQKRVDVAATEIGKLPNGAPLLVPAFSFFVWTVNELMYRDTRELVMGTTSPFPSVELLEGFSLTPADFIAYEPSTNSKEKGTRTILVDGRTCMNIVLWKGETNICDAFEHTTTGGLFNSTDEWKNLPLEVLATVDFSPDTNLSSSSMRSQKAEDSALAAANNETFMNEQGEPDDTATLTKRGGSAHGPVKSYDDFKRMEVTRQYALAHGHVDMNVIALERRYCNLLDLMANSTAWAKVPVDQKRVPCVTNVTYPTGFNTQQPTTSIGKPTSHSQSPQQMSSRNSKQHLGQQVIVNQAAWNHACRSMLSRARNSIALDYLKATESDVEIFEAYGNATSRAKHKEPNHFHGVQACWQRLLLGTSRFEHHYRTSRLIPHDRARTLYAVLQRVQTLKKSDTLKLIHMDDVVELVLLELKISSGQTSNYFASYLHVDGNTTQSWETSTTHWRGNRNPNSSSMHQAQTPGKGSASEAQDCGALVVPCCQMIFMFLPHVATLHIHLVHVLHGSSPGRNVCSMVRLCGPRGFLEKRDMLTGL